MCNQLLVSAGKEIRSLKLGNVFSKKFRSAVWNRQIPESILCLWHILYLWRVSVKNKGLCDGNGSFVRFCMKIENRQRQGLSSAQAAKIYDIDKSAFSVCECRFCYGIFFHFCQRPLFFPYHFRKVDVGANHVIHSGSYVVVCDSHFHNLPECDGNLLAGARLIQGSVDCELKMTVSDF